MKQWAGIPTTDPGTIQAHEREIYYRGLAEGLRVAAAWYDARSTIHNRVVGTSILYHDALRLRDMALHVENGAWDEALEEAAMMQAELSQRTVKVTL